MTTPQNQPILMYLCYGNGPWIDEITFSIFSALRHPTGDMRIFVVTDVPDAWRSLPVTVEAVAPETMASWGGPHQFAHRRKLLALQRVLEKHRSPTLYLDGDTYFKQGPLRLFDRIGSGKSLMHMREGTLGVVQGEMHAALHAHLRGASFRGADGSILTIPANVEMWNAGVIGLHPDNMRLLGEAVNLCDQLTAELTLSTLEQFSVSYWLNRGTRLSAAADTVFHYWLPRLRQEFDLQTRPQVKATEGIPAEERAKTLWRYRPRPSPIRRARNGVRDMLRACGFLTNRLRGQG